MSKNSSAWFTESLAADAVSLFRSWWQKDRIRSSPSQGKLLRLATGAVLSINGTTIEVESRDIYETPDGLALRLICHGSESKSDLWITVNDIPKVVWCCDNDEIRLDPNEIEVWSEGIDVV